MTQWIRVAKRSELPPGEPTLVEANETALVLYDVDGTIYATDHRCAHQGGPLGDGLLMGSVVTCPWHAWQFDVRTGESAFDPEFRVRTFPVKVEDGDVFVELEPETAEQEGGSEE